MIYTSMFTYIHTSLSLNVLTHIFVHEYTLRRYTYTYSFFCTHILTYIVLVHDPVAAIIFYLKLIMFSTFHQDLNRF
jgi:hypothetical protein